MSRTIKRQEVEPTYFSDGDETLNELDLVFHFSRLNDAACNPEARLQSNLSAILSTEALKKGYHMTYLVGVLDVSAHERLETVWLV
jgi:hypothetical protein